MSKVDDIFLCSSLEICIHYTPAITNAKFSKKSNIMKVHNFNKIYICCKIDKKNIELTND